MQRAISGFHRDAEDDWVAELVCGHDQHVRHRPPFQMREWVLEERSRRERRGTPLECPWCDRAELPTALRWARTSPDWDEQSVPPGLLRGHRIGEATWGRLEVSAGSLEFVWSDGFASDQPVVLGPGSQQAIPPGVEHEIHISGPVTFSIAFLAVDRCPPEGALANPAEEGGDPACWAGLVCPECGGVHDAGAAPVTPGDDRLDPRS